jgi:TolB protein
MSATLHLRRLLPCLLLALAAPLAAQDVEGIRLGLMYQPEYMPGFVILPFGGSGGAARLAGPVNRIVETDLGFSDRFEMMGAGTGTLPGDSINLPLWKERGADWVLEGTLTPASASQNRLRLVLHDAVYGTVKEEATFTLPAQGDPNFRMAVHAASDEVVRWVTGERGAAATRISFVLEARGEKELYIIDYDGEGVQRATNDGSIALSPAWSPDGRLIAYTSYRTGSPLLYERDLQTGRDRLISDRDGINISPTYSPDGRTIAFSTTVAGNTELATFNRERNCCLEQQTTGRGFDSLSPTYSPDGREIAFVSDRLGEPHIYVMAAGGGEARLVSDYSYGGRSYNVSPDWSPAGRKIAYHMRIGETMHITVVDLETSNRRLLTNEGSNEDPSWAPDNRHVVFSSRDRDGAGGLFILDTVSGRIRPLLRGAGYGLPDWSPILRTPEMTR